MTVEDAAMLLGLDRKETAKALLASQESQSGLTTLWECGRLDLSMENLVLDPRFDSLFSEEEYEVARERLVAYGYAVL